VLRSDRIQLRPNCPVFRLRDQLKHGRKRDRTGSVVNTLCLSVR